MAIINEQALKSNIKTGSKNIYILFGNDGYLKNMYAKKIGSMCTEEDDIFNYQKFFAPCDLQDVYDAVMQFPVMCEKKFVILNDFDFEQCSKADFDKLCTLLSEVPDSCVFVLLYSALEINHKKNNKFSKLVSTAEKNNGVAVLLDHRTVPELVKMLVTGAAKRSCNFEASAAKFLIETAGEDINNLKNELEKLCAYVKKGDITKDTVESVCCKTVESSVYSLSRLIVDCKMSAAMKILDELFYLRVEPIVILSTISSFYVDMYRTFLGKERGMQLSEIIEDFGYKGREFVVRNAANDIKRFDANKFDLSFDALRLADNALKSFSGSDATVLEQLVVRLGFIALKGEKLD